jgi:hypothetical protein
MKIIYNNKEVEISLFDCQHLGWDGKRSQEIFTEDNILYNFSITGSERLGKSNLTLKVIGKSKPIQNSFNALKAEVKEILSNVPGDVRVGFTNVSAEGRLSNTAVPFYSPFGMWKHLNYDVMQIGIHLLNPEGDLYHKVITLPDNCNLVSYAWKDELSSTYMQHCTVTQEDRKLTISCIKNSNITAKNFSRLVPIFMDFSFDTTNQTPVTDFGTPYYVCEIPEIFGAY